MRYFSSCDLVYSEKYPTRSEAMKREYQLKQLTKAQKESLISGGHLNTSSGYTSFPYLLEIVNKLKKS